MRIKEFSFLFLAVTLVASIAALTPSAYAAEVIVENAPGSSVPGCEETNECFLPYTVNIDVGDTVTWENTDTAAHTATAGSPVDGPSGVFDSSLVMVGASFSHTFDEAGTFEYFCMVHPWMAGVVIVGGAMAEEPMDKVMMGGPMMAGAMLGLDIDPPLPFDRTTASMVTLSFTAMSEEGLGGSSMSPGVIDHLDYVVIVSKDGSTVWKSAPLHDHDGNLELQITPSEGSFTVTGGDDVNGQSGTGPYMVTGPVFMDNGDYDISGQIVGIEFQTLPTPIIDDFTVQVIPEFGAITMMALAVGIFGIIAITAKNKLIPKL